jgi:mRNA degradation ribonuclease J1/J2
MPGGRWRPAPSAGHRDRRRRRARAGQDQARKNGKVTAGRVLIDSGSSIDVVEDLVIKDRRTSPKTASCWRAGLNKRTGKVERAPEVVMRGFGGADITDPSSDGNLVFVPQITRFVKKICDIANRIFF